MSDRGQLKGRPQGGWKSAEGRAAYWRAQHESAIGALADLIAEHRELVEAVEALAEKWNSTPDHDPTDYDRGRVDQRHDMTAELLSLVQP